MKCYLGRNGTRTCFTFKNNILTDYKYIRLLYIKLFRENLNIIFLVI